MSHQSEAEQIISKNEIGDDARFRLDDLVIDTASSNASSQNNQIEGTCDDQNHDLAEDLASSINNQPEADRIAWLLEQGVPAAEVVSVILDEPVASPKP